MCPAELDDAASMVRSSDDAPAPLDGGMVASAAESASKAAASVRFGGGSDSMIFIFRFLGLFQKGRSIALARAFAIAA